MATRYPWQFSSDENRLLGMIAFSDERVLGRDCYDSANGEFRDLAGYDQHRTSSFIGPRAEITDGTPTFVDVGSRRAIRLDRTCHMRILLPNLATGTMYALFKATYSGSADFYPFIFGDAGTSTAQGLVRVLGSTNRLRFQLTNALSVVDQTIATGNTYLTFLGWDEENRRAHGTLDGTTVVNGTAWAATTYGRACPMINTTAAEGNQYVRIGDNDRDGTTTANANDYIDLVEIGFIENVPVETALAEVKDVRDTLIALAA